VPVKIEKHTFEVGLVEDLFVLGGTEEEGTAADVVDLASNSLGVVVDAADEAVAEDLGLGIGDAEVMLDVSGGLFEVEGAQVVADGDALAEGFEGGETELVGEVGLAEEDEGEERSGIHGVVEEETELVEELWGEQVGFVDDEEDEAALAGEVGEGGAELREKTRETEGWLDLESQEDLAIEGDDGEVGVGEVDDGVDVGVEGVGEGADGGGLAGADIAGNESREVLLEGEGEAALDFLVTARGEQVAAGDGLGERSRGEAVAVIEGGHWSSCSFGLGDWSCEK
jgi:hypothetical protein